MSLALSCAGIFGGPAHSASAMSAVPPLPLVAQFACGLVLVDFPPQSFAESNKRIQVSQLKRNLASMSVDGGVGIGLARSIDDLNAATHNASENAAPERWFRQRRRGDFDAGDTVSGERIPRGHGGDLWKKSEQSRPMKEACDHAKITPAGLVPHPATYLAVRW